VTKFRLPPKFHREVEMGKQAPEHKKGLELYDNKDTRSNLGESGSHGIPESKKSVGGTFEGSKGGASFAEGNPRLTSADVNPLQRAAQKEHERIENAGRIKK
jgi:hypothetical protein